MRARRIAGILCFFLAAALLIGGVFNVMRGPDVLDASGLGVSHAVGSLLPGIVALIVSFLLFKKAPK